MELINWIWTANGKNFTTNGKNVLRICIEKGAKKIIMTDPKRSKAEKMAGQQLQKCTKMVPWTKKLKMAQKNLRNSNKRELGKGPKGLQKGKEMINSFLCKETNATKKAAQKSEGKLLAKKP